MGLSTIRKILNYQFGNNVGDKIIEKYGEKIKIEKSKKTGRIRRVYIDDKLFGTIEPTTGFVILTFYGGLIVKELLEFPKYRIVVKDEATKFIREGKSVFNKFVENLDENILPRDIVLIVDKNDNLLAIGESLLSGKEIKDFKMGVAAKVKNV
ncbi:MAG: PUA domain-containing protein [Candidatus Nanopusillus sp.]|jgi:predicted RNA-binding protein (TIGR00451 family)|nr:PUA domain-containing protein [Candidatus Nanopusillus sp.]